MYQNEPKEIVVITSQDGVWREEKISLALSNVPAKGEEGPPDPRAPEPGVERGWSPFQWKRKFKETMSPGYREAMETLRMVDANISRWAEELDYLAGLLPKDPTKLPDIALILIEIKQRLDSIVEAGRQVSPAKDKKLQDFYGRFHVKIPKHLRTASDDTDGKIATAGFIGDFVHWIGKKLFELTDADIREMKRVVAHLLNTTRETVKSVKKTLGDMRSARKTGDIDKYIEDIRFIASEQADFRNEFSRVYDAYLKAPYEHALALEEQARREAEARGEAFKPSHEEVSFKDGKVDVIEVEDPAPEEVAPLDAAEDAEKSVYGPPPTGLVQPEDMPESEAPPTPPTVQNPVEEAHLTHPESGMATPTIPDPTIPESEPLTEEEPPRTLPSARLQEWRAQQFGGAKGPPSEEMDITPSKPAPQPIPESVPDPYAQYPYAPEPEPQRAKEESKPDPFAQFPYAAEAAVSQVETILTKAHHARFIDRLSKIAETENKYIVAAFMAKYSEELEDTNPKASAALLKAAQEISND